MHTTILGTLQKLIQAKICLLHSSYTENMLVEKDMQKDLFHAMRKEQMIIKIKNPLRI